MGRSEKLETYGNPTTMNFNEILHRNVKASQYYKNLAILETYEEVIEEIKNRVTNLEPNIPNSPNPYATVSTAFCLLFKLWSLQLTVRQLERMVASNNAYVRCLAFLYLRYVHPPAKLMEWYEEFLGDDQPVKVHVGNHPPTTVGKFIRDLLFNKKYFNTMLPPIPVPVMKSIEETVKAFDREAAGESNVRGGRDADEDEDDARPRRRPSPDLYRGSRSPTRSRSPESRRRSPSRERYRDGGRRHRSRSPSRERRRDDDRDRRERDRDRDYDRSRDRDYDRHRDYDRRYDRDYDRRHDRDYDRDSHRDRYRDDRYRDDRYRDDRDRRRSRSRSRSPARKYD